MTGEERRTQILQMLKDQTSPLSGTALADAFHVSRQVIVQDIALMRAENHRILSTNRGYLYHRTDSAGLLPKRVVSVRHTTEQVLKEFTTVLELGGKILDVVVEHELYGRIRVDLMIESQQDAQEFDFYADYEFLRSIIFYAPSGFPPEPPYTQYLGTRTGCQWPPGYTA